MPSIESTSASVAENIGRYERDRLLLKQYVATRSDEAFAALFHRYHAFVYCTCLREVRDPELAADATQIVFIALSHKAGAIQRGSALSAWLFQAARFAARDLARKERCRVAREQRAVNDHVLELSRQSAVWEEEAWRRVDPVLNQALACLSPNDRLAVLLRYFDGLTLPECGVALGLSGDAARMRIGRAVEKMRRHLQRSGVIITTAALATLLAQQPNSAAALPLAAVPALASHGIALHIPAVKGVLFKMNMLVWKPVIFGLLGAGAAMSIPIVAPMAASPLRTLDRANHSAVSRGPMRTNSAMQNLTGEAAISDSLFAYLDRNGAGDVALIATQPHQAATGLRPRTVMPPTGSAPAEKPLSADADQFAIRYEMPINLLPSEARTLIRLLAAQTVDEDANSRTKQILTGLRGLQKTYTVNARLDEAVAVRLAIRDFKQRMAGILPDPGTLVAYRGNVGHSYTFTVTGQTNGASTGVDSLIQLGDVTKFRYSLGLEYQPLRIINQERGASTEKADLQSIFVIEEARPTATVDYSLKLLTDDIQTAPQKNNLTLDYSSVLNLTRSSASVWGTDIYTDDSPLAAAAVHAGILREGEKGVVKVTIFAGKDEYEGTSRNGVTTSSYGPWQGSYVVEKARPLEPTVPAKLSIEAKSLLARLGPPEAAEEDAFNRTLSGLRTLKSGAEHAAKLDDALVLRDAIAVTIAARLGAMPDPGNLTEFRGHNDRTLYFQVTGRAQGSIWGTDIYTDDTNLGTAAVHAGLLKPGQTGVVQVTILPGMSSYPASSRHGIAANAYGAWEGSYRMLPVTTY